MAERCLPSGVRGPVECSAVARLTSARSDSKSGSMDAVFNLVSLYCLIGRSKWDVRMWEVMGAATKSSTPESRSTTAGRNLRPGVWWKSILIRTISPRRRVMDQRFVDRVVGVVRCFELPPPGRAPRCIVLRDAPLEYDLNLFPWGHLGCDLGRNCNLAVRREFTSA